LLIYEDEKDSGSIYISHLEGREWTHPYMFGSDPGDITDINSPYWEPSACLSPDGNTIYFVSDRPGGFGGRDIYQCVKLPNGKWSKASNLGPTINTPFDEDAPFMHPDGVTLFFSSNGRKTMGGFDIFYSVMGVDENWVPSDKKASYSIAHNKKNQSYKGWSTPQNMGYPINTPDDDIFFVVSTDGKRGYFSSVRTGGKGEKDIYMIEMPGRVTVAVTLLKGTISFEGGNQNSRSPVTITATNQESGELISEVHPNPKTMRYILALDPGKTGNKFSLSYECDNYRSYTEVFNTDPKEGYVEIEKNYSFKSLGTISISGKVTTKNGTPIQFASVNIKKDSLEKSLGRFQVKSDGTYSCEVPGKKGEKLSLFFEADGYIAKNEKIEIPKNGKQYEFQKNIILETESMRGTVSISGIITDKKTPVVNAKVAVTDNRTGELVNTFSTDSNGYYYMNFQRGFNYNILYGGEGYLIQADDVEVPTSQDYLEIKKDIELQRILKGSKTVTIFFDIGKATLRKESIHALEKFYVLLADHPTMKVEIGGHTDNTGSANLNIKLAQARADVVMEYLVKKGIDKERFIAKGFSTEPIAPNKTASGKADKHGMQLNRSVMFTIIEK
ncbi:MAG TPA: OmpA family protein, partial [Bacteroidia bacterium]